MAAIQPPKLNRTSLFACITMCGLFLGITSCKDIIEEDITNEIPVMILPLAGDTISEYSHFSWQPLEGATHYRLQIYSPSFTNPSFIAFDSITSSTSVFVSLAPNNYQYKLIGLNNGYSSQWLGPVSFTVDTIAGGQAQINLISPTSSNYYNAAFNGVFSWSALSGVSSFEFSLRSGTNYQTGTILHTQNAVVSSNITVNSVTYTDGNYVWGVKAYLTNNTSTQTFIGTFKIDATNPVTPSLVSPTNNANVNSPVTFSWSNAADVGQIQSPVSTVLEIASDEAFTDIVDTETTVNTSLQRTLNSGNYYWRAYNLDAAGNQGSYSSTRQLVVN
jgi:hypothetical protein